MGIGWEFMDWVHVAQEREQWQDLMNILMNL
jgi:hypothetical protein